MSGLVRVVSVKRKRGGAYRRNVRSRAAPMYRMVNKLSGIHEFQRMTTANYSLWTNTGFSQSLSTGNTFIYLTMGINYSLQQVVNTTGGGNLVSPISGYGELTTLFDQWRIKKINVKIYFSNNNSSINTPATCLPLIYYCLDDDDAAAETGIADILQRSGVKTKQLGGPGYINLNFKPRVNLSIPGGSNPIGSSPKGTWIDCGYPATNNYGLKLAFDNTSDYTIADTKLGIITFVTTIVYEFKNSR